MLTEMLDALQKGALIPEAGLSYVTNTKTGRFLANGYKPMSKVEIAATMKLAKSLGRALSAMNVVAAGVSISHDLSQGRYKSAAAKGVVNSIIYGVTMVNPILGIGLGFMEAILGDFVYDCVENNW